jgi:hypothetical protein
MQNEERLNNGAMLQLTSMLSQCEAAPVKHLRTAMCGLYHEYLDEKMNEKNVDEKIVKDKREKSMVDYIMRQKSMRLRKEHKANFY